MQHSKNIDDIGTIYVIHKTHPNWRIFSKNLKYKNVNYCFYFGSYAGFVDFASNDISDILPIMIKKVNFKNHEAWIRCTPYMGNWVIGSPSLTDSVRATSDEMVDFLESK